MSLDPPAPPSPPPSTSKRSPSLLSADLEAAAAGVSKKVSESELMSSYSTRGFTAGALGSNASGASGAESRPCLDGFGRLCFEDEAEDEEAGDLACCRPSLLVKPAAEGWNSASDFLLVPWWRSDPGITYLSAQPRPPLLLSLSPTREPSLCSRCIQNSSPAKCSSSSMRFSFETKKTKT